MNKDPSQYIPEAVGYAAEAAERISQSAHEAKEAAAEAARTAQIELKKARNELAKAMRKTEEVARQNPWATAGTMLGVGILLGAVGYRLFAPRPTLVQLLGIDRLPQSARMQAGKQLKAIKKIF